MKTRIIALSILVVATIFVIAQSLPISRFPNTPTPLDSDLFVLAQTQSPATNKNIRYDQLRGAIRSGLATEQYVNNATNNLSFKFEVRTNGTALGFVTNINWTYGMTGSLSSATAILGVDDSANTTVISNGLITQIITASNSIVSANVFRTNQWTTNLPSTPVNGMVWFQGFPSQAFVTNSARNRTWEWEPTNQSIRIGSIANIGVDKHHYLNTSNFWDAPNVAQLSYAFGSNNLVNAPWSTISGGTYNMIYTNSGGSFIGGGTNNSIQTNSYGSVIVGGGAVGANLIHVNSQASFIGGGSANEVSGGSQHSTIVGGFDNRITIASGYGFMGGGRDNTVTGTGTDNSKNAVLVGGELNTLRGNHSFIGGGSNNTMRADPGDNGNVIVGGFNNWVGVAAASPSSLCAIGGGIANGIDNNCHYSVISGGFNNSIAGNSTNSVVSGGANNSVSANSKFSFISGGENNSVQNIYGFAIGTSNLVTGSRSGAIGTTVTNSTSDSVTVGELISYNTPAVISGAGNGNTNYLLSVTSPKMLLGSSNVNIYGVSGTIVGKTHSWSVNITNLSADTWGIRFDSGTNRWKFQSWMYGTNAPSVLTNNTLLRLQGESIGTNTLVTFQYFSPAL